MKRRLIIAAVVLGLLGLVVTVRLGGKLLDSEYRQPARVAEDTSDPTPRMSGLVDEAEQKHAEDLARPYVEAEYRRAPVFGSRVTVWVLAQLHLYFAAFVLAVPIFALIIEFIGYMTGDKRYDNLAHEFTKLLSTSFSFTATLGAFLLFMLVLLYPKFMSYLMHVFEPTFAPYVALFFLEAIFLYSYYYGWGKFSPRVHLVLGLMLNLVGTAIMFIANAWLTFMMSPNGVSESGARISTWDAVRNFTWMPINIHRIIANVAFGGAIAAAYAAFRYLQAQSDEERAHYDWMGYMGNFVAVSAFLTLPFAGYWLASEIYAFSQTLGLQMMGGAFSWLFIIQAALIGMLFLSINYYLWLGMGRIEGRAAGHGFIKFLLASIALCFAIWATPRSIISSVSEVRAMGGSAHPQLGYFGVMSAKNTAVNIIILTTYMSFLLFRRTGKQSTHPAKGTLNAILFTIFGVAAAIVIFFGVYGYYVDAATRISFSVPQVLAVLFAMAAMTVLDVMLYRNAKASPTRWGHIPAISQYTLIFIAVSFTWLMGLMGYVRSGLRQHWHVYGVVRDTSVDAFTPTLGFATRVVSATTLIFFALIGIVFWLSSLASRKDWAPAAARERTRRLGGAGVPAEPVPMHAGGSERP